MRDVRKPLPTRPGTGRARRTLVPVLLALLLDAAAARTARAEDAPPASPGAPAVATPSRRDAAAPELTLDDPFDSPRWGNEWFAEDAIARVLEQPLPPRVDVRIPSVPASGFLVDGRPCSLPALYRTDRSMVTALLYGGVGCYSDFDPWFGRAATFTQGNPIAPSPATGSSIQWAEGYVEPGLAAIGQLGCEPLYAYAAATVSGSFTVGPDIYQDEGGTHAAVEKAYGGLLYAPGDGHALHLTAGRQPYTLGDGFLVHHVRGSTNVGDRRGLYLGARNAHDLAALFTWKRPGFALRAFYLDPDELEELESNTTFLGANAAWDLGRGRSIDATCLTIPRSDTVFRVPAGEGVDREGLTTLAAHARYGCAFGVPGALLEGQVATQTGHGGRVAAWAGYASAGYQWSGLPWKPALVVRYARWSGDDPGTDRYERWDPLLTAGSDEWAQGLTFSKVVSNSNLETYRLRLFVGPSPRVNVTLDYFHYAALERNNLGGNPALSQLTSTDLGDELMLIVRWQVSEHLFLQGVVSNAWPGDAIDDATGGRASSWTSVQCSLYWFF